MNARRVLVTGGSMGIGRAVAAELAKRGWRVLLVARGHKVLERTCAELEGEGHDTLAMDVSDESAWAAASGRLAGIDGLVCAAAVLDPIGPIGSYDAAEFRRTLDVNVLGTLLAVRACLPALRASGGAVVTFGGGGATGPLPRFDAYATSKAAVVRLTENLALELASDGVTVNCVAPGFVATRMHDSTLRAGPALVGEEYFQRTRSELERGGMAADAATELVCALLEGEPDLQCTGKLISAQWDPWRDSEFRLRLSCESDLATLRRIDDMFFTVAPGDRR